jgi:hypothetical protein
MAKIVIHRVCRRERVHKLGAVRLRRLENQVEVVRHADEKVQPNMELLHALGQSTQKALMVRLISEQPFFRRPTGAPVASER